MDLYDICQKIANIEEGMFNGSIEFSCDDRLMFVLKIHPAEALDAILSPVGFPVFAGQDVSIEDVEEMKEDLIGFMEDLEVTELEEVINDLETYIKENK